MKKLLLGFLFGIILSVTLSIEAATFVESDVDIEHIYLIATGNLDVPYKVIVAGVTKDAAGNQLRTFSPDVYGDLNATQKTTVANMFSAAETKAKTRLGIP